MIRRLLSHRFFVSLSIVLVLLFAAYIGSYVALSVNGRFEPGVIGLHGVKWYEWAPDGFVANYKWNVTLLRIYCVPYYFDRRFWHTSMNALSGKYPTDFVEEKDIGKWYRAALRAREPPTPDNANPSKPQSTRPTP